MRFGRTRPHPPVLFAASWDRLRLMSSQAARSLRASASKIGVVYRTMEELEEVGFDDGGIYPGADEFVRGWLRGWEAIEDEETRCRRLENAVSTNLEVAMPHPLLESNCILISVKTCHLCSHICLNQKRLMGDECLPHNPPVRFVTYISRTFASRTLLLSSPPCQCSLFTSLCSSRSPRNPPSVWTSELFDRVCDTPRAVRLQKFIIAVCIRQVLTHFISR